MTLSDEDIERLAQKVAEKLPVQEIAEKMLEIYLNTPFDRVYVHRSLTPELDKLLASFKGGDGGSVI
jgi:hypothetical protein